MSNPHLSNLHQALLSEETWTRKEHQQQCQRQYAERISIGISWPPVRCHAEPEYHRGRFFLSFRQSKRAALHDGIRAGDLVSVHPANRMQESLPAICTEVDQEYCSIRLEKRNLEKLPKWLLHGEVGVTKRFDERTFIRYRKGLEAAQSHESMLKMTLLGNWQNSPPSTPSNHWKHLNPSQQHAAQWALEARELAIIHGPPGTGKTHTTIKILQQLQRQGIPTWALADSNAAIDHLAVAASLAGLDVLRLGSSYRISAQALHLSYDYRFEHHPQQPAVRTLEKQIVRSSGAEKAKLVREKRQLLRSIKAQILQNHPFICATLATMAREAPSLPPIHTAIVDEATQAIEPAIWSLVPYIKKLVLVGDPHQLGPVVFEPGNPLQQSLIDRLLKQQEAPMLEVQHRMNDRIRQLVAHVYGERYHSHEQIAEQRLYDLSGVATTELTKHSVLWVDTAGSGGEELRDPTTFSLYNDTELELIEQIIPALQQDGVAPQHIGIIAPYSAQVSRLKAAHPLIECNTVNAFQGREKEVIICSFVRSNHDGQLGFVADRRRLTVALTRAKKLWIGIGDSATLSQSRHFACLFDQLDEQSWQSYWDWAPL